MKLFAKKLIGKKEVEAAAQEPLCFGVPLDPESHIIPPIVEKCTTWLLKHGTSILSNICLLGTRTLKAKITPSLSWNPDRFLCCLFLALLLDSVPNSSMFSFLSLFCSQFSTWFVDPLITKAPPSRACFASQPISLLLKS